jgi:signal transduction histidine kinase
MCARVTRGAVDRACPDATEAAATLETALREAAEELQGLIRWLRPARLDDADLVVRLAELSELASSTLPCELRCESEVRAAPEVEAELLRIAQLALHGLVRRSGAKAIELDLEVYEQELRLTARAAGATRVPSECERLGRRAAIFGGSFEARHEGERLTLTCRLPARV